MNPRLFFLGCMVVFTGLVSAQNAPHTVATDVYQAVPGYITVPVTVTGFTGIAAFSLDLQYDPAVMTFIQGTKNSLLSGSFLIGDQVLPTGMHHLVMSWFGTSASLPDGESIVNIKFNYLSGTSQLSWIDDGSSSEYADFAYNPLNDLPTACYYRNGIVTDNKCLNLTLYLEGLYDPDSHKMNSALGSSPGLCEDGIADRISVELHNAADYSFIEQVIDNIDLSMQGMARVLILPSLNNSYYITVRHRNSIATVSAMPVSFSGNVISYNFSDLASEAFGNNMIQMSDGKWALYSGDVNQDNFVNTGDMILVENDASAFSTGYLTADCNGDGLVDSVDMILVDNNAASSISSIHP